MLTRAFDAIIFDCDGTLVDSEPITVAVLIRLASELGIELDYHESAELFVGRDLNMIAEELTLRTGSKLPDSFVGEFRSQQAAALRSSLKAIDGSHELLGSLKKPFCLASNAPHEKIKINLEVTGLGKYFDRERVFSAYDIQTWKPQPDLFLMAAEKLGVEAERCVVIEDSLAGIDAGLAAGMQVIGFSPDPEKNATNKVPFVQTLAELRQPLC